MYLNKKVHNITVDFYCTTMSHRLFVTHFHLFHSTSQAFINMNVDAFVSKCECDFSAWRFEGMTHSCYAVTITSHICLPLFICLFYRYRRTIHSLVLESTQHSNVFEYPVIKITSCYSSPPFCSN